VRECPKLVKARKLLREYEAEKKQKKKKPSPPKPSLSKLPELPLKPRKSTRRLAKHMELKKLGQSQSWRHQPIPQIQKTRRLRHAAFSKDILGKASPSTWAGDTGASSHMSDQPSVR
jgi:hypothetical protein